MNPNDIRDQLKNEYPYRLELHAHTYPVSRCSEVSPTELVDIYRSLGFNGLVVTNHFYSGTLDELPENQRVDAYLEASQQAKDYAEGYGMKIYLGAELRFDENANDYLLYGADEAILRQAREYFSKGLACYRRDVSLSRSVLLQAHPFRPGMVLADPALLDGVEAYNMHCGHNNATALAVRYGAAQHFAVTSGDSEGILGKAACPKSQGPFVASSGIMKVGTARGFLRNRRPVEKRRLCL